MERMSLRAACDQARQWLESNDLDRAIGLCEHILQAYPRNLEAYRILGEAYLANRQLDRAQDTFERVLRSDPENIPAHVGLGIAFERRGKLERAVQEFEQALEIKPDMPELRSQLLRLYSDGGIENAQLRLSRAGLARLYAKGQMLPQAVAEFRHVIKEQPDRTDVKIALAETLWRDEQEADSAALCRRLVDEHPELLKAQLLLGYIGLGSGNAQNEANWRAAAAIDPELNVARAMFDPLPAVTLEAPMVEAWDEQAWRRLLEEQEQIAATRQMQSVTPAAAPEPVVEVEAQDFVPGAAFFSSRSARPAIDPSDSDDFLAGLLDLGSKSVTPSAPTPALSESTASVAPAVPAPTAEELGLDADMLPFSLSDLGLSEDEIAGLSGTDTAASPATAVTQPIAAVPSDLPAPPVTPVGSLAEPDDLPAFSFDAYDDLSLPDTTAATPSQSSPTENMLDQISAFSFGSLDDLPDAVIPGTSPSAEAQPIADPELDDLAAFSFEPFNESPKPEVKPPVEPAGRPRSPVLPVEPAGRPRPPAPPVSTPAPDDDLGLADMQPFSLSDLGLNEDEIAGLDSIESTPTNRPTTPPPATSPRPVDDLPTDLQPFSMDALDQANPSLDDNLPSALQPFSMDDAPAASGRRVSGLQPDLGAEVGDDDEEHGQTQAGFSWQQPSQRSEPEFVGSMRPPAPSQESSLFDKLKQKRDSTPLAPLAEPPDVSLSEGEHLGLFSVDDVPLRDDAQPSSTPPIPQIAGIARREGTALFSSPPPSQEPPTPPAAPVAPVVPTGEDLQEFIDSGSIKPFSFADLGLSEEEVAELGIAEPTPTPTVGQPAEVPDTAMTIDPGDLQPFSLSDLGLSAEEIAALGLGEAPPKPVTTTTPVPPPEPEPVTPVPEATRPSEPEIPVASTPHEHIEIDTDLDLQSALAAGEVKPFSFADLGLSDEEIAALGLGEAAPVESVAEPAITQPIAEIVLPDLPEVNGAATPSTPHEHIEIDTDLDLQSALAAGEVKPFSFADLGLSDEEIAALGLGEATPTDAAASARETPIAPQDTTDDLPDFGLAFDFAEEPAARAANTAARAANTAANTSADPLDLGLNLDLEAPEPATQQASANPPSAPTSMEDDLQPFSLTDFGFLGDEDSADDVGLPNNLAGNDNRLGLTVEELADLDVGGDVDLQAFGSPTPSSLDLTGINTGDPAADRLIALGRKQGFVDISDIIAAVDNPEAESDRIEAIGQLLHTHTIEIRDGDEVIDMDAEYAEDEYDEPEFGSTTLEASQDVAASAELPDMTPFSLSELGLSDDEIALLGGSDEEAAPATQPAARSEAPDLMPLSLDDLDSLLEPADTPSAVVRSTPEEPDMTPFSLSDLGLSDDEISTIETGGAEPTRPAAEPEPVIAQPTTPPQPVVPSPVSTTAQAGGSGTGNALLDDYLQRVEREPDNHSLRLSVARASARLDHIDLALRQYKTLARRSDLIEDVVEDLIDLIEDQEDPNILRQLHRALGDAFSKQGLMDRAMAVYAWTPGLPKATH